MDSNALRLVLDAHRDVSVGKVKWEAQTDREGKA
jgi:hypothetical protein